MVLLKIIGGIVLIALCVVLLVVFGVVTAIVAVFGELAIWIIRLVLLILIATMLFKMVKDLF